MPQLDFRKPRLFVDAPLTAGETVALERRQSNYLGNVLRLSAGDTILVFNGCDGEWQASIAGRKRPDSLTIVARTLPQDRLPDLTYVFSPLINLPRPSASSRNGANACKQTELLDELCAKAQPAFKVAAINVSNRIKPRIIMGASPSMGETPSGIGRLRDTRQRQPPKKRTPDFGALG